MMADRVVLGRCVILMGDEPAYVRRGVEDLRSYLHEITGDRPGLRSPGDEVGRADTVIIVGRNALMPCLAADLPDAPQSYVLRVMVGEPTRVVAAGADPQGTKHALVDLVCAIEAKDGEVWLPSDLSVTRKPHFLFRGMYAHLHWQYNNPYALRSWSLDQWKRYIDLLAYMKINLFQIWTMAAICPNPLSTGDEAYLKKYREVVRYAREERGMEVWPGECANNIAESDFGQPIEQREYFQAEVLKNPADPQQFRDIMDNRANMYRLIDNGDGYWIIDSDPGKWKGSPASELADIFAGNRDLIDRRTEKGRDAKLVYWMWQGWGTGTPEENWRGVIEGIEEKVHEPWWLTPCNEAHLALVKEMGLMEKSVFFPYGVIEPEPSNPFTHVKFAHLWEAMATALRYPGLAGIMGNAQTPFAQLPNIFYLAQCAWDPEFRKLPDQEVLRRLGTFIFPEIADELAEGWLALMHADADTAFKISRKLESLVSEEETGKPGPGGQFIFPKPELIVRDLALLVGIHARAEQVRESVDGNLGDEAVGMSVLGYVMSVLEWQKRTGFHGCRVNGVDFQGGGTLLHGRDFVVAYKAIRKFFGRPGNGKKRRVWAQDLEKQLVDAGFTDSVSKRAVLEVILEPGQRRSDGRL